jgi:hypothetical protein
MLLPCAGSGLAIGCFPVHESYRLSVRFTISSLETSTKKKKKIAAFYLSQTDNFIANTEMSILPRNHELDVMYSAGEINRTYHAAFSKCGCSDCMLVSGAGIVFSYLPLQFNSGRAGIAQSV